jgi:hypothetical protein
VNSAWRDGCDVGVMECTLRFVGVSLYCKIEAEIKLFDQVYVPFPADPVASNIAIENIVPFLAVIERDGNRDVNV